MLYTFRDLQRYFHDILNKYKVLSDDVQRIRTVTLPIFFAELCTQHIIINIEQKITLN